MNLQSCFDRHFFRKYNIRHLVFDLRHGEVLLLFGPGLCSDFDLVEAFEVLGLQVGAQHLIDTETCKLYIFLGYETNGIEGFLVGYVTQ